MNAGFDARMDAYLAVMTCRLAIDRMTLDTDPISTAARPDCSDGLILNKGRTPRSHSRFLWNLKARETPRCDTHTRSRKQPALVYGPELEFKTF